VLSLTFGRDYVELTMTDYVPEAPLKPIEQRAAYDCGSMLSRRRRYAMAAPTH
jgi:hypothetical protein